MQLLPLAAVVGGELLVELRDGDLGLADFLFQLVEAALITPDQFKQRFGYLVGI